MQTLKQIIGIDVSKDTLEVCFGSCFDNLSHSIGKSLKFNNDLSGFKRLLSWVKKQQHKNIPLWFVMEATGVYYENLAYFLAKKDYAVAVILPNKVKSFMRTLDNKSKTDMLDARALTQFGLEKSLKKWQMPSETMKTLRDLIREYLSAKQTLNQISNRLHAKQHAYKAPKEIIKRQKQLIKVYNTQLGDITKQIEALIKQDIELSNKIAKVMTIKGIGFMTVVTLIAETNGFSLISNSKQLTSYAGMDIVHNQSGYRTGKTTISRKGNRFIRSAMYMPALCAIRFNNRLKDFYTRLVMRKNIKMIGITAVMRKLLGLVYTLWKKDQEYIPNY